MADHPRLDFTVSLQEFGPAVPGALAKGKVLVVEYESEDNDEYIELSAPGPGVNGSDGHVVEAFIRGCYFGYRSSTSGTTIRVESRITRRERKTEEQENEVRQKEKLEQENKVHQSHIVVVVKRAYVLRDSCRVTSKLILFLRSFEARLSDIRGR